MLPIVRTLDGVQQVEVILSPAFGTTVQLQVQLLCINNVAKIMYTPLCTLRVLLLSSAAEKLLETSE